MNQTDIEDFYKEVEALKLKFPVAEISRVTGYSKGNVSDYLNKKKEPSENFINRFKEHYGSSQKVLSDEPLTMQALVNLTESNKTLAEANKSLASSHAELTTMVKTGFTGDVLKETGLGDSSTILDLLVVLADVGVKAGKWHSKDEALAELHRIGVEFGKRGRVKGIRDGVGSSHKR